MLPGLQQGSWRLGSEVRVKGLDLELRGCPLAEAGLNLGPKAEEILRQYGISYAAMPSVCMLDGPMVKLACQHRIQGECQ